MMQMDIWVTDDWIMLRVSSQKYSMQVTNWKQEMHTWKWKSF